MFYVLYPFLTYLLTLPCETYRISCMGDGNKYSAIRYNTTSKIKTCYMNISYAASHKQGSSILCQCIMAILQVLIVF
jgi:hypothetical protein